MPVVGAVNGSLVQLQIRTATGPDVYVTVGGQRGLSIKRNRNTIDTSAKGDADETFIGGRRGSTVSMDAMVVAGDVGRAALIAAHEGTDGVARLRRGAIGTEPARQADCIISKIDENLPDDKESTWSVDLQITGAWTAVSP